jgi:diguanylate cyclase (GGDEF)-like protein
MGDTLLRLLIVEDSEEDTQLLVHELRQGGFEPIWQRVETAVAMIVALDRDPFDLVVADFTMPSFSGTAALEVLRARNADLPFIFVSGTIGEDAAVEAMRSGAHDYVMKGHLQRLVPAIRRELREAILRREHRYGAALVQHLAYYDALTDLPNRALLYDRLNKELAATQRENKPFALMILDLDGFKEVNDTLGHSVGDALLQQVGQRIQGALREVDTVARLGGDEFALLLPGADADTVMAAIARILTVVEHPFQAEGLTLDVHGSIGVALCPSHGVTSDLLMQRADIAMYVAKESKGRFAVYSAAIDRHSQERLALVGELTRAIRTHQLVQHYQPKVSLLDGQVQGLEVLSRWPHPTRGLLPPERFIGLAEQTSLINDLTLNVIDTALRACRHWRTEGWTFNVSVNLSPETLRDDAFPDAVAILIDASGPESHCLELEITENVLIMDPARALATLTRLSKMGIRLSIDDFGTGYSSLRYLEKLPVQELKIDRSFIMDLAKRGNETIVKSTIDLAHNLGLTVIAEGVETLATWDRLVELGCDAAQGFYICPPVPIDEMTVWLGRCRRGGEPAQV